MQCNGAVREPTPSGVATILVEGSSWVRRLVVRFRRAASRVALYGHGYERGGIQLPNQSLCYMRRSCVFHPP